VGPSRDPNLVANSDPAEAAAPFPYGSDDPHDEPDGAGAEGAMLRYLRQHGNYLTPGKGITLTSVIVVLLRGIILNLLVWIPIVAALMWLSIAVSLHWLSLRQWSPAPITEFLTSISPPSKSDAFESSVSPSLKSDEFRLSISPQARPDEFTVAVSKTPKPDQPKLLFFGGLLAVAIFLLAGCVLAFAGYSIVTWMSHEWKHWLLGGTKYTWRRGFEKWARPPLWIVAGLLLLASVPFAAGSLHGWVAGSSFSVIGLASGLMAFLRTMRQPKGRTSQQTGWAIPSSWRPPITAFSEEVEVARSPEGHERDHRLRSLSVGGGRCPGGRRGVR
jgi:hypothetical protein